MAQVKVWFSFLYEHKSFPEKYALVQVGEYLLRGYRKQIAEKTKPLSIEEMELPVKDKTKNYLLQMIEEGREEGREEIRVTGIRKLIRNGSSTELICDVMGVTQEYVDRIRASMEE